MAEGRRACPLQPVQAIICANVLVVEFELMALCMLFGIQLNTVTMCIFVMNFGLVFGACDDDPGARAKPAGVRVAEPAYARQTTRRTSATSS